MKNRFLIFIPGYNCAPQIPKVLEGIKASCYDLVDEIVYVDNQSKDGTLEAARAYGEKHGLTKLKLINNHSNYGLGGSHKVAFRYAIENRFDYVIILHGDNQADPREIPLFLNQIAKHPELDAVLGDRFSSGAKREGYSLLRTFGNRGVNFIYSLVAMRNVRDTGAGLNVVRVARLKELDFDSASDFCDFHTQLLLDMLSARFKLSYQLMSWREEDQKSNINPFAYGITTLKILLRWRFRVGRKPSTVSRTYDILPISASFPRYGASL